MTSIEAAGPGGLGLPLTWRPVDSLPYRRDGGRNRPTFAIARRPAPSSPGLERAQHRLMRLLTVSLRQGRLISAEAVA
jgi:hypothetical protein